MIVEQTFEVPALSPALALILRMHGLTHDDVPQDQIEEFERRLAEKLKEAAVPDYATLTAYKGGKHDALEIDWLTLEAE